MAKLKVINPYTLESFQELEIQSKSQAFDSLEKCYKRSKDRKALLPAYKRIEILEKTSRILFSKREQLIQDALQEGGKPYQDTAVEIDRGLNGIAVAIQELSQLAGRQIPMELTKSSEGRIAYTHFQPKGVAVAISAFNHPFNLAIHQVIPAVAIGCPVLIKPASTTPLSARHLIEALYEAGLPEDAAQFVICENEVAEALVKDTRTSFLSFIGSANVGWHLRSKLPPGASCTLEHGGVAPVIVDQTADLKSCIPALVKAGYYHAGQVCVSVQRIFVHEKIKDEFTESFINEVKKLKTGDPKNKNTDVGPLISEKEINRVHEWVEEAKKSGAKIALGGNKISKSCYEPTVILDPDENLKVSQQEVFGPVTCVYSYKNLDEAIQRANNVDYAFQASIFTSDLNQALKAAQELEGLGIMINDHTAFRVDWMPFGAYKRSGLGTGGIGYSMRDMCIEKLVVIKQS